MLFYAVIHKNWKGEHGPFKEFYSKNEIKQQQNVF